MTSPTQDRAVSEPMSSNLDALNVRSDADVLAELERLNDMDRELLLAARSAIYRAECYRRIWRRDDLIAELRARAGISRD